MVCHLAFGIEIGAPQLPTSMSLKCIVWLRLMTADKAISPVLRWFKSLSGKRRASRHYDGTLCGLAKSGLSEEIWEVW